MSVETMLKNWGIQKGFKYIYISYTTFEDIRRVIRRRKTKKDWQYNSQIKRDKQRTTKRNTENQRSSKKSFLTSAEVNVYIFITYRSVSFITMNEPRCIILVHRYRRCCITPQFCCASLWHNRCLIWVFNDIWFVWNKYIYLYKIYRRIRFFSQILEFNLH